MLRASIMCPDQQISRRLSDFIDQTGLLTLVRSVDQYLSGHALERFLRAAAPQVLFVSFESVDAALEVVAASEKILSGIQVVAIGKACDSQALMSIMQAGIREFLPYPFEPAQFSGSLERLRGVLAKKPVQHDWTDMVFSFLPAKAGVGTSTVALNTSLGLARHASEPVLIADFDLNSGLIGFMLKVESTISVYDAAENVQKMDESLWPQLVTSVGNLHVLPAGRLDPESRIEASQVRDLLRFARRLYKVICLDLSGNMEKFSLEIMHESKRVFVVTTPEIPALHLARQKLLLLKKLDLGDRAAVLLNRSQKRSLISMKEIEHMLGVPVLMSFPNDYRGVHKALTEGEAVAEDSELGRHFTTFGQMLVTRPQSVADSGRKKQFLEYFTIPSRSSPAQTRR